MFKSKYRVMEEVGEGGEKSGGEGPTVEQLQAQLTEATTSINSLKSKNDELLGETKKAKNQKREEEAARQAAEEAKAKEAGDHEQLYKSSEAARQKLLDEHNGLLGSIATEKRNNAAMKVAADLADGSNADLLSEFIAKRLKFSDGAVKVTDSNGDLTVSSVEDLKTEFKNDPRYSALLKGNQSSGGGATGGSNSGGAAKTITRPEWDNLMPSDRVKFAKSGGKII